jgi:hypothetical protein
LLLRLGAAERQRKADACADAAPFRALDETFGAHFADGGRPVEKNALRVERGGENRGY